MGMTRSFYYIVNRGLSEEKIRAVLSELSSREDAALTPQMRQMMEKLGGGSRLLGLLETVVSAAKTLDAGAFVVWREGAALLPFFETSKCEGYTASSLEDDVLAQHFRAPVLSFAVMDSDVLFVSYRDREAGVAADCARTVYSRPDRPDGEEELYDTKRYKAEFPEFLLDYCQEEEHERLRRVWDSQEYVFAEERMEDICRLIGAEVIYGEDDVPEGFRMLRA